MKFEIEVKRHFPHPIDDVWAGLTSNAAISEWLMEADSFEPRPGQHFDMTCVNEDGEVDVYRCQVLELDPPDRMVWSWVLAGNEAQGRTEVEFRLTATEAGTTVKLIHRGDRDRAMLERFKAGWPYKFDQLGALLDGRKKQEN